MAIVAPRKVILVVELGVSKLRELLRPGRVRRSWWVPRGRLDRLNEVFADTLADQGVAVLLTFNVGCNVLFEADSVISKWMPTPTGSQHS